VGNGPTVLSSSNGVVWSGTNIIGSDTWPLLTIDSIAWGNGCYLACAGTGNQAGSIARNLFVSSTNGVDWQNVTLRVPTSSRPLNVAYLDRSFWITGDAGMLLQSDSAIPSLSGAALPGNAGFQLTAFNAPSLCRIQASTNLNSNSWQDLVTLTNPPSPFAWTDTNNLTGYLRFYRLKSP
jgi:hypothetical protein